jgi:hypothetical protein
LIAYIHEIPTETLPSKEKNALNSWALGQPPVVALIESEERYYEMNGHARSLRFGQV